MTTEMTPSTKSSEPTVNYELGRSVMQGDITEMKDNIAEFVTARAEKYLGVLLGADADRVMLELLVEALQEELGH